MCWGAELDTSQQQWVAAMRTAHSATQGACGGWGGIICTHTHKALPVPLELLLLLPPPHTHTNPLCSPPL